MYFCLFAFVSFPQIKILLISIFSNANHVVDCVWDRREHSFIVLIEQRCDFVLYSWFVLICVVLLASFRTALVLQQSKKKASCACSSSRLHRKMYELEAWMSLIALELFILSFSVNWRELSPLWMRAWSTVVCLGRQPRYKREVFWTGYGLFRVKKWLITVVCLNTTAETWYFTQLFQGQEVILKMVNLFSPRLQTWYVSVEMFDPHPSSAVQILARERIVNERDHSSTAILSGLTLWKCVFDACVCMLCSVFVYWLMHVYVCFVLYIWVLIDACVCILCSVCGY